MAKMRTFKQIRESIEALPLVKNKETFLAALPLLVEMTTKLQCMRKTVRDCAEVASDLNEVCSTYALYHESVFVNGLITDGKGVRHGDVDVNGTLYHFAAGFGKFIREDGDNMTQEFISKLPSSWTKGKLEIDTTAMNRLGLTDSDLEKAGLIRSANNVWSLPVTTDGQSE